MGYHLDMTFSQADHEEVFYAPRDAADLNETFDLLSDGRVWDINRIMMRPAEGEICEGSTEMKMVVCLSDHPDAIPYFELVPVGDAS